MSDETEDNNEEGAEPEGAGAGEPAQEGAGEAAAETPKQGDVKLDELSDKEGSEEDDEGGIQRTAQELEAVFDVPVSISAVLGRTHMEVSELLHLESGDVIELDRKVGEAIDIYVNNRLIARGEVVLLEDKLGITMTEIIKTERH